jgi:hypothetical protein
MTDIQIEQDGKFVPHLIVIQPNGETTAIAINKPPSGEELQGVVGGWFEQVPGFNHYVGLPCIAYACEEGKRQNLAPNMTATKMWMKCFPRAAEILLGPVALVVAPPKFLRKV